MRAVLLGVALALVGCATASSSDPTVMVNLHNNGAQPLQCRIQFGHWVDRDLGVLAPNAGTRFQVQQQPKDGALYVERDDGQRRMMIENIFCNAPDDLQATVSQVDLSVVRAARAGAVSAACRLPATGHVICDQPVLSEP
jgi:hypothetical protein